MKKVIVLLFVAVCLAGCTYEGSTLQTYVEDPTTLIQDPHFTRYQEKRDTLERAYLHKEITYADYLKKRDALDDQYAQEVQQRDHSIAE